MMKKLINIVKKYKFLIIVITILVLCLIVFTLFNMLTSPNNEFRDDYLLVNYDNSWNISDSNDNAIVLEHKNGIIFIEVIELEGNYKYYTSEDLLDNILYEVSNSNDEYNILKQESSFVTKNGYEGYQILYEKDSKQVLLTIGKSGDKLLLISYEAETSYFDILLDSVNNIIFNTTVVGEKFEIENSVDIKTSEVNFKINDKLDSKLDKLFDYNISYSNYSVDFSVPEIFILNSPDTSNPRFTYEDEDSFDKVSLDVAIYNRNVYEYLDKDDSGNIYDSYDFSDDDYYIDFNAELDEFSLDKYNGYIYSVSYNTKGYLDETEINKTFIYEIILPIDVNNILIFTLESKNIDITEELINSIKINEVKNYSTLITSYEEDGYLKSLLKRYTEIGNASTEEIYTLKLPVNLDEYGKTNFDNNKFEEISFGYNYNEDKMLYDYTVDYTLTNINKTNYDIELEYAVESSFSKSSNTDYKGMTYVGDVVYNNNTFKLYDGWYTSLGGIYFTNVDRFYYRVNKKMLIYEIDTGGFLIIEITGNDIDISDQLVNDLTNFDIDKK